MKNKKVVNKKPFQIFAARWAKTLPPARPAKEDIVIYRKLFNQYKNKTSKTKLLILGATPELRDLAASLKFDVTVADFNIEMIRALTPLRKTKSKEKFIVSWWQKIPLKDHYDIVVGDVAVNMLDERDIPALFKRINLLLVNQGAFIHRDAFYNAKKRVDAKKIIQSWQCHRIDIGDFRWLIELYSQYKSYNPKTGVDSKTILYQNVHKMYEQGLLTKTELDRFGVFNDNVRITILTQSAWKKLYSKFFKLVKCIKPRGHIFCQDLPVCVYKKIN